MATSAHNVGYGCPTVYGARMTDEETDHGALASEVSDLVAASNLTADDFAARLSISRERLLAFMSGDAVPSLMIMNRIRMISRSCTCTCT